MRGVWRRAFCFVAVRRPLEGESAVGWLSVDDIPDVGEVVVRLKDSGLPLRFLGLSVHQIATVTGEGDILVRGEQVPRECIEGWLRLPRINRESQ